MTPGSPRKPEVKRMNIRPQRAMSPKRKMKSIDDHEPVKRSHPKQTSGARKVATPNGIEESKITNARMIRDSG
jgi:hypothetical protein